MPRRLTAGNPHPDPVRRFIKAFNEHDLDGFVATLDAEIELHSNRGMRKGIEAARSWATRAPGGVQQTIVLDELYENDHCAVALITRKWHWAEDGTLATEDEMAWVFELKSELVTSWRSCEDRHSALADAGFLPLEPNA